MVAALADGAPAASSEAASTPATPAAPPHRATTRVPPRHLHLHDMMIHVTFLCCPVRMNGARNGPDMSAVGTEVAGAPRRVTDRVRQIDALGVVIGDRVIQNGQDVPVESVQESVGVRLDPPVPARLAAGIRVYLHTDGIPVGTARFGLSGVDRVTRRAGRISPRRCVGGLSGAACAPALSSFPSLEGEFVAGRDNAIDTWVGEYRVSECLRRAVIGRRAIGRGRWGDGGAGAGLHAEA